MKIIFFGRYHPLYSRNRVLLKGLRQNGVEVTECRVNPAEPFWPVKLLFKYLSLPTGDFDAMIVAFPGQEAMLLARMLTRKPIIFDAFTSHYGGHVLDRGNHKPHSLVARWYHWLDTISCRLADLVLLDTEAHIHYFVEEFKVPKDKFRRVFVGTDSDIFKPQAKIASEIFTVHFHGNFIPLQGVEYIVRAAGILQKDGIKFNIIGRGQTYRHTKDLAHELEISNINWVDAVPYEELPMWMAKSDACLGIFGHTLKTQLVIPNKIFEALACARPVITARTPAIKELLKDGESIILCNAADPEDLAKKIRMLKNDSQLLESIEFEGSKIFKKRLTEKILVAGLIEHIKSISK